MMHICLISREYPPDTNWGGIATYTRTLAAQLVRLGCRVSVVAQSFASRPDSQQSQSGVMVYRLQNMLPSATIASAGLGAHQLLTFAYRAAELIRTINAQHKINIVEVPDTLAQAYCLLKAGPPCSVVVRLHTPYFWAAHLNNTPESPAGKTRNLLEQEQAKMATALSSPTRAMAAVVARRWQITREIPVIPNFFALTGHKEHPKLQAKLFGSKKYLLYFGRLEERKGMQPLAAALPQILASDPKLYFGFIGSDCGPKEQSRQAQIRQQLPLKDQERLIFHPNLDSRELYPIIRRAKAVVLPSLWENFAYCAMEAMALGQTVIASNGGGFPEVITDQVSGFLPPAGDSAALAATVIRVLDRNLGTGPAAQAAIAQFTPELIVPQLLDFYRQHGLC